jgi:hypothetical protein
LKEHIPRCRKRLKYDIIFVDIFGEGKGFGVNFCGTNATIGARGQFEADPLFRGTISYWCFARRYPVPLLIQKLLMAQAPIVRYEKRAIGERARVMSIVPDSEADPRVGEPAQTYFKSLLDNLILVVTTELIALPFCFGGEEGAMEADWKKALIGFGVGLPIGVLGLTFPVWGKRLAIATQIWLRVHAWKWWLPIAVTLAFAYVLGPGFIVARWSLSRHR